MIHDVICDFIKVTGDIVGSEPRKGRLESSVIKAFSNIYNESDIKQSIDYLVDTNKITRRFETGRRRGTVVDGYKILLLN